MRDAHRLICRYETARAEPCVCVKVCARAFVARDLKRENNCKQSKKTNDQSPSSGLHNSRHVLANHAKPNVAARRRARKRYEEGKKGVREAGVFNILVDHAEGDAAAGRCAVPINSRRARHGVIHHEAVSARKRVPLVVAGRGLA